MSKTARVRSPIETGKRIVVAFPIAAVMISLSLTASGGGFEPYSPSNEQLRRSILGVWESQVVRPPAALERSISEALRSIKESEGRRDPRLAGLLSSRLRKAWAELERSRFVGGLGYKEFDEGKFEAAEAKFQEVLSQFVGARTPYPDERYQALLRTLADAQALSQDARRPVPGLSSDDVLLMREKRQKLLLKEPRGVEGLTPQFGIETGPSR